MEERITHAVATTGVASATAPWWLPSLDQISKVIALIYSILGIVWLVRQITKSFSNGK
jgi:hypothetical protein